MSNSINVFEKIFEEIRHRYSPTSIIPGACDNETIFQLDKKSVKILKRYSTVFNPNLKFIVPELSDKFPIRYAGYKKETIYTIPEVVNYCRDIIGIDPTTKDGKQAIHEILDNIAKKELKLAIIGYGGAMINFLWNTYILAFASSYNNPIFKELTIFERESISFTNILRLGKPVMIESYLNMITDERGSLPKIRLIREEFQLAEDTHLIHDYLEDPKLVKKLEDDGYIFLGAPNFEARNLLENSKFFFFGHANNEFEITYCPRVDAGLAFETYGSIDIPVLLANIAVGSLAMLDIFSKLDTENMPDINSSIFKIDYGVQYGLTTQIDDVAESDQTQAEEAQGDQEW